MQRAVQAIRLGVLICLVSFCARGQNITIRDINQDTKLAEHSMEIAQIEDRSVTNTLRIDKMSDSVNELRIEIASAKYAVYGFGFALTFLQFVQVLTAFKKPTSPHLKDRY
jgi:hypothetical protein